MELVARRLVVKTLSRVANVALQDIDELVGMYQRRQKRTSVKS
jgi:hypothetical protein